MDFTIALAHFCEVHGPMSLICTQALPSECSTCYRTTISTPSTPTSSSPLTPNGLPYMWSPVRPTSAGPNSPSSVGDTDRCASCRMSLPDDAQPSTPLRTKEAVHVCGAGAGVSAHNTSHPHNKSSFTSARSSHTSPIAAAGTGTGATAVTHDDSFCHSHQLVYRSSPSPADADSFASLRRATVRTLSGEQLPRGQTSGPLWFGDSTTGYTIAYVFRLADMHARGRQRYYALLALAGTDTTRAFEACTLIWECFEGISKRIIRSAEAVAAKVAVAAAEGFSASSRVDGGPRGASGGMSSFDSGSGSGSGLGSPPGPGAAAASMGYITPISSFLTGRATDPDGFPRRGTASWRAKGIAELVDNESFFCELHMIFVTVLQELGRRLGGMRVRPARQNESGAVQNVVAQKNTSQNSTAQRTNGGERNASVQPGEEDSDNDSDRTAPATPVFDRHRGDFHLSGPEVGTANGTSGIGKLDVDGAIVERGEERSTTAKPSMAASTANGATSATPSTSTSSSTTERGNAVQLCSPGMVHRRQQVAV